MVDQITQLLDDIDRQSVEARRYPESAQFEEIFEQTGQLAKAVRAALAHLGHLEVKYDDYNAIDHIVHSITHELRQAITDALKGDEDAA